MKIMIPKMSSLDPLTTSPNLSCTKYTARLRSHVRSTETNKHTSNNLQVNEIVLGLLASLLKPLEIA